MILDWLGQTPILLASLLVVFVPGTVAMFGAGLRGLALFATAPLFTVAATAVIAVAFGAVGIGWSPLSWGIAVLLLIAVSWAISWALGHRIPWSSSATTGRRWIIPVALALGIVIAIWRLAGYISDPSGISQTNDAVFHMNAIRFILETSDASSMHVNAVIGGQSFYPAAWHGVVSLIVMITGAEIPVTANIVSVVIGAFIWPLGIAWLARTLTGSDSVAGYAAVLSSALQTFPLLMFQWGVLFPNALSIALIPAGVALVMSLPRWSVGAKPWQAVVRGALLILVTMGALLLSQPAAILPWAAILVTWLTFRLVDRAAMIGPARAAALGVIAWLALIATWLFLANGTSGSHWPPFRGKLEVAFDVLLNGHVLVPFAFGISVLMIIGLVIALRHGRLRWFAVAWLGISLLYVMVAAIGNPFIRAEILGAWYADPYRIAALAPIVVIPLAAIGVDGIAHAIARLVHRSPSTSAARLLALGGTAVFMIVLVLLRPVAMPAVLEGTYDRESRYLAMADAYLNPDERALLESLDELVDADARIIGNPSTGTAFGYFLSGLDVYPRTWSPPTSGAWTILAADLRDVAEEPQVCEALAAYDDPEYVLDFGIGEQGPGRYQMPGMTDFAGQDGFELVVQEGTVSLWRITACAQ
ncbi:DUF6541 family protein [Microbacterium murale]|uniref:Uncharacterized protein n=1 Tax=Microbacterium murale TaxID=1081040 RepID=A0ABQ1RLU9_9MICO|nr:DUF6541 family protein [Microbacterium murale]GGD72265.1 hypothetical protein GCM10007269_14240 [Microbacterium murale]